MKRRKLLKRLSEGQLKNVAFGDMINMVKGFVFGWTVLPAIPELVNLRGVKEK